MSRTRRSDGLSVRSVLNDTGSPFEGVDAPIVLCRAPSARDDTRLGRDQSPFASDDTRLGRYESSFGSDDTRLGRYQSPFASDDTRLVRYESSLGSDDPRLGRYVQTGYIGKTLDRRHR